MTNVKRQSEEARIQAQKLWNEVPCGDVVDAPEGSLDYFLQVETLRYRIQGWQHDYFRFKDFKGKKILEIGVGQGTDQAQFAKAGAICNGIDITQRHLDLTALNFKMRGFKTNLQRADATQNPHPDNSLDAVYSFGVIFLIPEIDKVMSEIYRVLKPGGVVMLACYYRYSAFWIFWKILLHGLLMGWLFTKGWAGLKATIETGADGVRVKPYMRLDSKRTLRNDLKRAGFIIQDISVHQLQADSFWPTILQKLVKPLVPKLENKMGWYVCAIARKPHK